MLQLQNNDKNDLQLAKRPLKRFYLFYNYKTSSQQLCQPSKLFFQTAVCLDFNEPTRLFILYCVNFRSKMQLEFDQ